MKKILISIFILLSTSLVFSEEVTPIYEYRNEALRNIDAKMDAERDRGRLKKLHNQFEEELKNYVESVNGNAEIIFQLGNQYFRMNQYERARKIFSMDKTDIRNVFGAATTSRFLGRNEEAISLYNDTLNIDSSFYEAYLGRGIANRNLQNYDSALNDFRQYLNYKQDEYVYAGMGDIYMATENYTEARNILEKGRSLYPNSKIIRELLVKVYAKIK
ncbi:MULTISPECIES: tetratricopeptide repeat protein [Fusobacterium]|jgi:tetratricopeptide (TPR) repeat protein|uniref:Tetratricopeptide repeat protein n=1 Tax=Fusobacterium varium ATCC 27725 TaxID=469618 RepID=A0ABM6U5G8_FUSVA|nr:MULTISPECIES: tetratricopeptide repeat protein [Fusobacterium]AVQ31559.1 tetratricopeptide repeat protein [Fusobacterium varium ATCC 27725]EES62894.1 tetratricopeptide repeat protein [Fusobacterium varium ATCC 27725]MCI6032037.1 tetratricopeptide repeat protein [Fusobacterium varium]MDY4006521.1 tetratricopeptide repeat protein [Fusobacterium varium]RGJ28871.1 tetratricopeptide repeat protein [Fusobacterium varium]